MPLLTTRGAASVKAFGFTGGGVPGSIAINYLLVGGAGSNNYAGGGGGQVLPLSGSLSTKVSYSVSVASRDGVTTFNSQSAGPGLPGNGAWNSGGTSYAGYGGGGGSSGTWPPNIPPWTAGGDWGVGGGGGGAGGGGGDGYTTLPGSYYAYGGDGGPGVTWSFTGSYYGGGWGGGAASNSNTDGPEPNAYGGANGAGADAFSNGTGGGAIVTYVNSIQLFTGGTVTSSGSGSTKRWFHTFASSGTLTHIY